MAVDSDSHRHSSPIEEDSDLRTERVLAYRAGVDSVYQQPAIKTGDLDADPVDLDDYLKRPAEVTDSKEVETPHFADGDVPDDPRSYCNPKTGRFDASWSVYDRAISAAREHAGGDLGPDSIKMYDQNPETGEGTGTLIGEQTPDRLRGWRIDGRDGHVNWWDWTAGKKGSGGAYGHDWFPEDLSVPGSRYIGWAPWQDSDGHILEGN